MPATLKPFQDSVCAGIVARFDNVRALYAQLANAAPQRLAQARRNDAALVLQAPTGAGKTLIAVEAMRRTSSQERVLWFWFAPFTGLVEQSRRVIAGQAPELALFDLDSDRQLDTVRGGGVFVVTWASLAARSADSRRARQTGDAGLSIDALIALARAEGLRIGCVVDEAHHGFQRAAQARAFFSEVLQPDYALLMTATPRDADMAAVERATG
jgi:superfamily II DNA or RNA helicase